MTDLAVLLSSFVSDNAVIVVLALLALACAVVVSRENRDYNSTIAPQALELLQSRFDQLSDQRRLVTRESLQAARRRLPDSAAEIDFLLFHLAEIGQVIDTWNAPVAGPFAVFPVLPL